MLNMKIYVVGSSKNKFLPLSNIRQKFLVDIIHNEDNIDNLNPWYCELTGLYYLWKHVDDDIVGLEHYRRYFINDKNEILTEQEINSILKKYDIIAYKFIGDNAIKLAKNKPNTLTLLLALIHEEDKNMASFFYQKFKENYMYQGNMFITKKEIINEYCEWLFNLLTKFDEIHKFKIPRIDGFMAEYIFGAWLEYKKLKIKDLKIVRYSKDLKRKESNV